VMTNSKNVLTRNQNILAAKSPSTLIFHLFILTPIAVLLDEQVTFVHPSDAALYDAWKNRAFDLQVANHELLGHGTGKLFQEYADGTKNFDPEKV
jgi:hypothetical protein